MKRFPSLALLALLAASACAGVAARDEALLPAMRLAWPPIAELVERGTANRIDGAQVPVLAAAREMTAALDSGDRERVAAVDWPILRFAAAEGIKRRIEAGEIGPGVAESLAERILQFDAAFWKLGER